MGIDREPVLIIQQSEEELGKDSRLSFAERAIEMVIDQMYGRIEREPGHFGLSETEMALYKSVAERAGELERQRVEEAERSNPINVLQDRLTAERGRISEKGVGTDLSWESDQSQLILCEQLSRRLKLLSDKVDDEVDIAVFDQRFSGEGNYIEAVDRAVSRVGDRADADYRIRVVGGDYAGGLRYTGEEIRNSEKIEEMMRVLGIEAPRDIERLKRSAHWKPFNIPEDNPDVFMRVEGVGRIGINGVPGVSADIYYYLDRFPTMDLVFGRDALKRAIPMKIANRMQNQHAVSKEGRK